MKRQVFQPGVILHGAIIGAFRAQGSSFGMWCDENGVPHTGARQATYGQSGGETGRALLARIIDAAGREVVEVAYRRQLKRHARDLDAAPAAPATGEAA